MFFFVGKIIVYDCIFVVHLRFGANTESFHQVQNRLSSVASSVFQPALRFATPPEMIDLCIEACRWHLVSAVRECLEVLESRNCISVLDSKACCRLIHALARQDNNNISLTLSHSNSSSSSPSDIDAGSSSSPSSVCAFAVEHLVSRVVSTSAYLSIDDTIQFLDDVSVLQSSSSSTSSSRIPCHDNIIPDATADDDDKDRKTTPLTSLLAPVLMRLAKRVKGLSVPQRERLLPIAKRLPPTPPLAESGGVAAGRGALERALEKQQQQACDDAAASVDQQPSPTATVSVSI